MSNLPVDENRLYRRIPIVRRLVPSVRKRLSRFLPRSATRHTVRITGLDAAHLHIIGDSHTGLFSSMPRATVHYLGPVTMHRVGRDGVRSDWVPTTQPGAVLGFVFGEIDVRVHIAKQRDRQGRDPLEIIDTLTTKYLRALEAVSQTFPRPIIVFSVVPPAGRRHPNFDRQMPRNGTDGERIAWTWKLNDTLRRGAYRAGFGFVDQYTPFADKSGLLDLRQSCDGVHVTPRRPGTELACTFSEGVSA